MQTHASKVDSSKALDADLVVMKSNGIKSEKHDTSSSSGNYLTHVVDADIRPVNNQMPFAEVQLTAQYNVLANEQQYTEQFEPIYDIYLLEKIDSNTTSDLTNMSSDSGKGLCEFSIKNELRKLKGTSVDTKFVKPSILGKPVLQPPRNQSVVRQSNAFKSELCNFSKPRFASQVDVNYVLSKLATPRYFPKVREYVLAKPHHVIAHGSSRNSQEESFSLNKSSAVHKKPNTPRSCLRWKLTGKIFKIAGLKWIPTGKMFTDSTTKVDSEPPNGSNDDITNPYECGPGPQLMTPGTINSGLVQNIPSLTPTVPPTKNDWDSFFNLYAPSISTLQTTSKQQSLVIPQGGEDDFYDIEVAHMDNDPYFGILISEPILKKKLYKGSFHQTCHLNQSFDTLTKMTKKHPLENVIGDPSRPVSTRSELQDNPIPFGGKLSG
uniref:Uncharacterized protein n=1 Tax=Tanacetum cinerariifolium TaxID=118510 RepID=A0A6L2KGR6_TANCI|nr:hypothetical protein [Tanacetum cinerariifolium]